MARIGNKNFEIIDAHAHVVEQISGFGNRGELRSIGNGKAKYVTGEEVTLFAPGFGDHSFTHDRLVQELEEHGISQAILMQGSFLGFCNEYTYEAQEKYAGRLHGMGTLDPFCLEYKRILNRLVKDFKFKGLKFEISTGYGLMGYHPELKIDGALMRTIWEYAEEENLVVSLDMGTFGNLSFQIDGLACIAKQYPGINFVVEHLFYPGLDHFEEARKYLEALSKYENIYYTTASVPNSTLPEKYPYPSAWRYLEIAKEVVGADRLMWGSDLPTVAVNASYSNLIDYIYEAGIFSEEELEKVYSKNAIKFYKL